VREISVRDRDVSAAKIIISVVIFLTGLTRLVS
jgi:hypothetical protein